jgi:hypothetical protein
VVEHRHLDAVDRDLRVLGRGAADDHQAGARAAADRVADAGQAADRGQRVAAGARDAGDLLARHVLLARGRRHRRVVLELDGLERHARPVHQHDVVGHAALGDGHLLGWPSS